MALEWLKSILGDAYTEDVDKKVSDKIGKDFVARADFNSLNKTKSDLETQLKNAGDVEAIKAENATLQARIKQAEKDSDAKLEAYKFDGLLTGEIAKAKGKNAKAITALLDVEALRKAEKPEDAIKEALDAVAKDNTYLFDTPPAFAPGTGTKPVIGANTPEAAWRAAAGLKPAAEKE